MLFNMVHVNKSVNMLLHLHYLFAKSASHLEAATVQEVFTIRRCCFCFQFFSRGALLWMSAFTSLHYVTTYNFVLLAIKLQAWILQMYVSVILLTQNQRPFTLMLVIALINIKQWIREMYYWLNKRFKRKSAACQIWNFPVGCRKYLVNQAT